MEVTVWTDYVCPWAYGARPRTEWLAANGTTVRVRAYELHPRTPREGRPVRPGGRLDKVLDHIAAECARTGLAFTKPKRSPNSRRALELLELVQTFVPEAAARFDALVANAHWVQGIPIDDENVLQRLATEAIDDDELTPIVLNRYADGEGAALVDRSKAQAHDVGVTATPAWRIGEFTLTGLHSSAQFERWMRRIIDTTA